MVAVDFPETKAYTCRRSEVPGFREFKRIRPHLVTVIGGHSVIALPATDRAFPLAKMEAR